MGLSCAEVFDTSRLPPRSFYARPTKRVARDLLGAILLHRTSDRLLAGRIVEVEAYLGSDDPAAHSSAGLTARTRVIFGAPGYAYVYRIYGMYCCLNIVAEAAGDPGCVLIRALEPLCGAKEMWSRRPAAKRRRDLCNGPGKLTSAMAIGIELYGADLLEGPLTIRLRSDSEPVRIGITPRIGITKAADLELRFFIADNEYVSH